MVSITAGLKTKGLVGNRPLPHLAFMQFRGPKALNDKLPITAVLIRHVHYPELRIGGVSGLQVAQLSQACKVVPFRPGLNDLAVPNTIDCDVFCIHNLAG